MEAERAGISEAAMRMRYYSGALGNVPVQRMNSRVFVLNGYRAKSALEPKPDEIPLKVWIANEARRSGMNYRAVEGRFGRGKYPHLNVRRVNARVIYVQQ